MILGCPLAPCIAWIFIWKTWQAISWEYEHLLVESLIFGEKFEIIWIPLIFCVSMTFANMKKSGTGVLCNNLICFSRIWSVDHFQPIFLHKSHFLLIQIKTWHNYQTHTYTYMYDLICDMKSKINLCNPSPRRSHVEFCKSRRCNKWSCWCIREYKCANQSIVWCICVICAH